MIFLYTMNKQLLNTWIDCGHTTTIRYDNEEHWHYQLELGFSGHTSFYTEIKL